VAARVKPGRPVRVFMTADAVGGVWQYALDVARGLRPHGVETTLAVLGPSPSADQQVEAAAAGVTLIPTDLPLDWTAESPEAVLEAGRAIAALAAEHAPDLVHLNSPALAAEARFPAPVVAVCHSCVATWWAAVRGGALPQEFVWRTDFVRRGYAAASALTAPTAAFAAATAEAYRLPQTPTVVRNGRRAAGSDPTGEPEAMAFTAGRLWDDGKNLAVLDRAAARLAIPVEAAGPLQGPNGARIALQHLRTLGRLSDEAVAARLARQPIFVSVARYEPFGLAVLEAAQAGCALVLADIPTFRELWDGAALFVSPDDEAAIANTIQGLADDPARRADLGAAARERSHVYSVEAMTEGLLAVYRSLLAKPAETAAA
jgi:glycosyltransferase involved in cell wall biosynthesis